ncbi:kinase-like domain-containing protein [Spinellus fusiger]|nr:kinase-like domain-containing protein [Spinellus fusiger]
MSRRVKKDTQEKIDTPQELPHHYYQAPHGKLPQRRRQSVTIPHSRIREKQGLDPIHGGDVGATTNTRSLGHKLDHQYQKTIEHVKENTEKEKILLKHKDGSVNAVYQLGNCIGKGQFGSVYRGLDLTTGEIVAVKRVKIDNGELDQEEMMKEVSLLKVLSHTNVIQYIGFIRTQWHINIVQEYAENGSLMSTLKAFGSFPEKLVAAFTIKILNGLEYLHANDVVHCDLKAANILTTKTGDVKLTDFGVSLNLKIKAADAGAVSGTPNWMAPEVIELKGASTKADIWSLGCTVVELATGKPPYANLISMSAMFRIVEDDYPPIPSHISQEMHSFLLCCFQKNPDHRPTATQLKEHIWIQNNQHRKTAYKKPTTSDTSLHSSSSSSFSAHHKSTLTSTKETHHFIQGSQSQYTPNIDNPAFYTFTFIISLVSECKVCNDAIRAKGLFCKVCFLICHEACRDYAFSCPPKVNEQQPSYDVSTLSMSFFLSLYKEKKKQNTYLFLSI